MKVIIFLLSFIFINNKQLVEVVADEISFDKPINTGQPIDYIKEGRRDFGDDISKYNGKLYYKDPKPYYGPSVTYSKIYENDSNKKFLVNFCFSF
jgi:hypothetical protein